MEMIRDGFQKLFGNGRPGRSNRPAEPPRSPFPEWARPLAEAGQVHEGHLNYVSEIERWTKEHKAEVLLAAASLRPAEPSKVGWQIYRLSTQTDDGREVARALTLYQGVLRGQDSLRPEQRETVFLNMLKLHQNADKAHGAYQAYVQGESSGEERLLGDMSTVNPAWRKGQGAEAVYKLFEVARALPGDERELFLSIFRTHGIYQSESHANTIKQVWESISRQPDRARATADFLELRQDFADRHPSREANRESEEAETRTGFAARVLREENEGLPIFTRVWRQEQCDPFYVSEAMRVLRERVAEGQAGLTFSDAVSVRRGLLATRDLARTLSQDDLSWLAGQFSVQEHAHVATALARVAARSAPSARTLLAKLQELTRGAGPEQKSRVYARLHDICAQAILFDGDADLSLEEIPAARRGVTITENRVQVGSTSLKRRLAGSPRKV